MFLEEVFEQFLGQSPVSVMVRATLENVFAPERLDAVFHQHAILQDERTLLFSTCAELLGLVVARVHGSVCAAFRKKTKEKVGVTLSAVYQKLAKIEPHVCRKLLQETAGHLREVLGQSGAEKEKVLPGFDLRILDGNHLAGTQHRLKELRTTNAAALPGQAIAVLDPQRRLIDDVLLIEDGHANQRPFMPRLLATVQPGQCWVADRDFCTLAVLFGLRDARAYFIVRQHAQLQGTPRGKRRKLGRVEGGTAYEQPIVFTDAWGRQLSARQICVVLDEPNREGETEIRVLTNLPRRVKGRVVAATYRQRWRIETAFGHLAVSLRGEVDTLGYPPAALFGFTLALLLYNVLSVTGTMIEAAQRPKLQRVRRRVSLYALATEVAGVYQGLSIALPETYWKERFAGLPAAQLGRLLMQWAGRVRLEDFLLYRQSPKKPPPKRTSGHRGNHVSTARLLQQRKASAKKKTKNTTKTRRPQKPPKQAVTTP